MSVPTLLHGTSAVHAKSIGERGLIAKPDRYGIAHGDAVWFTTHRETARLLAATEVLQHRALNGGPLARGLIVTVELPVVVRAHKHPSDPEERFVEGHVPPDWIRSMVTVA